MALLLLLISGTLTTASAQPAAPEDLAARLETIECTLADPSTRAALTVEQWQVYVRHTIVSVLDARGTLKLGPAKIGN